MDEDKIIRKISLEFFDVPYEELTPSEQLIVRNELKKEIKRIGGPIPRPPSYAGGGMMNMDEMTRPIGYTFGGSVDELGTGLKKLKLMQLAGTGKLGLSENRLEEMDILNNMSVIEIDALFDNIGEE